MELISCAGFICKGIQLICAFVFACSKSRFSHDTAYIQRTRRNDHQALKSLLPTESYPFYSSTPVMKGFYKRRKHSIYSFERVTYFSHGNTLIRQEIILSQVAAQIWSLQFYSNLVLSILEMCVPRPIELLDS